MHTFIIGFSLYGKKVVKIQKACYRMLWNIPWWQYVISYL